MLSTECNYVTYYSGYVVQNTVVIRLSIVVDLLIIVGGMHSIVVFLSCIHMILKRKKKMGSSWILMGSKMDRKLLDLCSGYVDKKSAFVRNRHCHPGKGSLLTRVIANFS